MAYRPSWFAARPVMPSRNSSSLHASFDWDLFGEIHLDSDFSICRTMSPLFALRWDIRVLPYFEESTTQAYFAPYALEALCCVT